MKRRTIWVSARSGKSDCSGAEQPAHPRSLISAFYPLSGKFYESTCYKQNFYILGSLCIATDPKLFQYRVRDVAGQSLV